MRLAENLDWKGLNALWSLYVPAVVTLQNLTLYPECKRAFQVTRKNTFFFP
jgi:hypothetical protein